MKKITKFFLNVTSVGSILSIATLNAFQLTVVGQPTPNVDSQPITQPGRVRFVEPTEDNLSSPNDRQPEITQPGGPRSTEDIDDPPPLTVDRVRRHMCWPDSELSLTALVPKNKIGRTVSDSPTFFFYLPQTDAELAEFILQDENYNVIYQQDLTIKNLSGVIGVSIPANTNVPPLEVGKNYTWKFTVVCDPEDRSSDWPESGIVRRVEVSADILRKLENANPRQKTVIYAENGIWQDALSTLAAARRVNPNDTDLVADWKSLLDSVELGEIVAEPMLPIEPQP
jgi:Domain of Unknown Function (DUF928)